MRNVCKSDYCYEMGLSAELDTIALSWFLEKRFHIKHASRLRSSKSVARRRPKRARPRSPIAQTSVSTSSGAGTTAQRRLGQARLQLGICRSTCANILRKIIIIVGIHRCRVGFHGRTPATRRWDACATRPTSLNYLLFSVSYYFCLLIARCTDGATDLRRSRIYDTAITVDDRLRFAVVFLRRST